MRPAAKRQGRQAVRPGRHRRAAREERGARPAEQGRRAARLRREPRPRHRRGPTCKLKPSEFLAIWAGSIVGVPVVLFLLSLVAAGAARTRWSCSSACSSGSCCRASGSAGARPAALGAFNKQLPDTITLLANAPARRLVVPPGDRARRARVAPADLDRVRPRHPRGQPRPAVRAGAGEHGPPRQVRGPRADGHRHRDPAHRSAATSPRSSTRSRSRSASASGSRARSGP